MEHKALSIRPFIGSKNFEISRNFYKDLGFEEIVISHNMCLLQTKNVGFYLQDAYVKDWIDNTMLFLEVEDVQLFWEQLVQLNITEKYKEVKIAPIRNFDWGSECFIHDPSGILWHIGSFNK